MKVEFQPPKVQQAIMVAAPILTAIYLLGHLFAYLPPLFAVLALWEKVGWGALAVAMVISWAVLVPILLMIYWGVVARLLPAPQTGPIETTGHAIKNALLTGVFQFARVTASRVALSLVPVPSWLFYRLVGAKIHFGALISSPDCLPDPYLVEIGRGSIIGQGAILSGHFQPAADRTVLGRIEVGQNVLIGAYSCVFPGTKIGDNSIIQIKSVVYPGTEIPPDEVWGGIPARKIKDIKA